MPDVLFIKTSSLGDVIHHMPAVTDARHWRPGVRISWVVEEAFAPLVRLHPAVDVVIPVAARRWRSSLHRLSTWRTMVQFIRELRSTSYEDVIDTQGLLFKSAVIARCARGRRHGYDSDSIRERAASWLYDVRHGVSRDRHAIDRNRALTGLALGYAPEGPPDFGLDRARIGVPTGEPYGVLLHGTARPEKEWPERNWRTLAERLGRGLDLILLHGSDAERTRAERIAAASPRARAPVRQPLGDVAKTCAGASFVVGVDTGLLHLAAALGVPLVAIFTASEPGLTGPRGQGPMSVLGGRHAVPTVDEVAAAVSAVAGAN
jgi:heptosyltransferase I